MKSAAVTLGFAFVLGIVGGCQQNAEASRAILAQRRESWARELATLKEQHAVLAARFGERGEASRAPAGLRTRAVLDGARQSIVDVESQLQQVGTRIEQAISRGGDTGEKALEEESVRARGYMQALSKQLVAATEQVDALARN